MKKKEFKDKNVVIDSKPWLGNAWHCALRGGFLAPIIMVDGKVFHQYKPWDKLFDRGKLAQKVESLSQRI